MVEKGNTGAIIYSDDNVLLVTKDGIQIYKTLKDKVHFLGNMELNYESPFELTTNQIIKLSKSWLKRRNIWYL